MVSLLFAEYRFFQDQSEKLVELQEQYHNYLIVIQRVFYENNLKEKSESQKIEKNSDEKKNRLIQ